MAFKQQVTWEIFVDLKVISIRPLYFIIEAVYILFHITIIQIQMLLLFTSIFYNLLISD